MIKADSHEIAWVNQNTTLGIIVALFSAALFISYAAVDWLIDPGALAKTLPLRVVGVVGCLSAGYMVYRPAWRDLAPIGAMLVVSMISVVVTVIFLGILHEVTIAITAHLQILMAVTAIATLRYTVRALVPTLLVSFNLGLWWIDADGSQYALANCVLIGALVILLVVSEAAYRTFKSRRLLEANQQRIERELSQKDAMFRAAIETTSDGFWATDAQARIVDVNEAYLKQSGYSRQELLRMRISDLDALERPDETAAHVQKIIAAGSATFETQHRRKDGTVWPVEIITTYSPINGGRLFVFSKDLTERKKTEEITWRQANLDSLTQLPNRALWLDRFAKVCATSKRTGTQVVLLFTDLDGFKFVNDSFGHDAGDFVLQEVARRWLACVRESDTVARIGGDEFVMVLGGLSETESIAMTAEKLVQAIQPEFRLPGGQRCSIGASIGISIFPADADTVNELVLRADAAMYESKRRGKNRFTFYNTLGNPP